ARCDERDHDAVDERQVVAREKHRARLRNVAAAQDAGTPDESRERRQEDSRKSLQHPYSLDTRVCREGNTPFTRPAARSSNRSPSGRGITEMTPKRGVFLRRTSVVMSRLSPERVSPLWGASQRDDPIHCLVLLWRHLPDIRPPRRQRPALPDFRTVR